MIYLLRLIAWLIGIGILQLESRDCHVATLLGERTFSPFTQAEACAPYAVGSPLKELPLITLIALIKNIDCFVALLLAETVMASLPATSATPVFARTKRTKQSL